MVNITAAMTPVIGLSPRHHPLILISFVGGSSTDAPPLTVPEIVGIAVGGVAFLLILIIIIVCCVKRRNRPPSPKKQKAAAASECSYPVF